MKLKIKMPLVEKKPPPIKEGEVEIGLWISGIWADVAFNRRKAYKIEEFKIKGIGGENTIIWTDVYGQRYTPKRFHCQSELGNVRKASLIEIKQSLRYLKSIGIEIKKDDLHYLEQ